MSKGQAKELQGSHNPRFTLSTANFRTLENSPFDRVLASSCLSSNVLTHFEEKSPRIYLNWLIAQEILANLQIN